jgi:DNA-binding NarL/FixJ family response regulator
MVTALLVDDHPLFRDGFASMLKHHRPDWTLTTANSAAEALAALDTDQPDLAIIDILLPDVDGFDAARAIAERAPLVSRVMISGREDGAAKLRSRDCGASGFISKAWAPERILEMLEQVLAGGVAFETATHAAAGGKAITSRQLEVLTLLADGHSNKAIERRMNIAPRTVRAHLTEIFHLLEVDGRVQAILKARQLGLIG